MSINGQAEEVTFENGKLAGEKKRVLYESPTLFRLPIASFKLAGRGLGLRWRCRARFCCDRTIASKPVGECRSLGAVPLKPRPPCRGSGDLLRRLLHRVFIGCTSRSTRTARSAQAVGA